MPGCLIMIFKQNILRILFLYLYLQNRYDLKVFITQFSCCLYNRIINYNKKFNYGF